MKSVAIHALLAVFGLGFAYQTYTRPPETEEPTVTEQPVILQCEPGQFTSIELETPTHTVKIAPKKSGTDTEYWITNQRKPAEKPPEATKPEEKPIAAQSSDATKPDDKKDATAAAQNDKTAPADKPKDGAAETPPEKKQPRPFDAEAPVTFLANAKFDDLVKGITPLRALRTLGEVKKDKDVAFGFDKVGTYFRMECAGKKVQLDVGGRTYGTGDRYAREPKGAATYLVDGKMLMDLQSSQFKFMQGELNDFTLADVDEAVISALGKSRTLKQRNRQVKEQAAWVDAAAPDKRNELFGNWFERVGRLKAKAYLGDGKEPGSDLQIPTKGTTPVLTIEYKLEGKSKDKVELVRVDTDQGGFYYARSNTTKRWVTMYDSLAKQVEEDAPMIVGAEEPPAESSESTEGAAPAPGAAPKAAAPAPAAVDPHAAPAANPHAAPAADPHAGFKHP
jgi:hypothetical protein